MILLINGGTFEDYKAQELKDTTREIKELKAYIKALEIYKQKLNKATTIEQIDKAESELAGFE